MYMEYIFFLVTNDIGSKGKKRIQNFTPGCDVFPKYRRDITVTTIIYYIIAIISLGHFFRLAQGWK